MDCLVFACIFGVLCIVSVVNPTWPQPLAKMEHTCGDVINGGGSIVTINSSLARTTERGARGTEPQREQSRRTQPQS